MAAEQTTGTNGTPEQGSMRADMRAAFRGIDRLEESVRLMRDTQIEAMKQQALLGAEVKHLGERLALTESLALRMIALEHKETERDKAERRLQELGDCDRKARQGLLYSVVGSVAVSLASFVGMLVVAGWAVVSRGTG